MPDPKMSYLWEVVVYWYEAIACKSGAGLPPNGVGRLGETGSDGCRAGRFSRPGSWSPLVPLSGNIPAMRWLVRQIRLCNPVPPEQPHGEAAFLMLAAFCPDNRVLGFLIDTWRHYCRTGNGRGCCPVRGPSRWPTGRRNIPI